MKVRLRRDIYRYENGVKVIYHRIGEIMEGELLEKRDFLVGCQVVKLNQPMKNGDLHLGVDEDCEIVQD